MLSGKRQLQLVTGGVALAVALAGGVLAASGAPAASASPNRQHNHPALQATSAQTMQAPTSNTPAAGLRTTLNGILQEHVYLAGAATGAALAGRQGEFQAAAGALDANSVAMSKAIGSVYGDAAEQAFLPLWRAHITMFVDYTQAVAANDTAKKTKALADLDAYRTDFDVFLSGANPNLPRGAVAELLKPHVTGLAMAIDAQAANDPTRAYMLLREAAAHMPMIGDPLTEAIVKQFPQRFAASTSPGMQTAPADRLHLSSLHSAAPLAAQGASLEMRQFTFTPNRLQVAVGSPVTWTNRDGAQHTVTAGEPSTPSGAFDSGLLAEGATFSQTFSQPGLVAYYCMRHPSMVGQIEVTTS